MKQGLSVQFLFAKWPFRSSSQAATCYYQSNHSKVKEIPLSVLPAYFHSNPFKCWTSSREAVNINF